MTPKTPRRGEDAFLKQISDSTRNSLDLPSVYDVSPERYRLVIDGTRTTPTDTTSFEDRQRDFLLAPAAGETVEFYSAERPRYVVGYEAAASWAFEGLTEIGTDDTVRIGVTDRDATGNGVNRAYFEFTPGENRCVLERAGTEVDAMSFRFPDAIEYQSFVRPEIQYNAYDAGRWLFSLSYTHSTNGVGEKQEIVDVAELAVDDAGATNEYNFHLWFEVDSPSGTTELSAGSMAYRVLGNTTATYRPKTSRHTGLSYGGSGDYEAVLAMRKAPDASNVFTELTGLELFLADGSGEAVIVSVPESDTDASGFSVPSAQSAENSVFETTTNVSQFPDSTGSVVTSAANPGGYQIAFSATEDAGSGGNRTQRTTSIRQKRELTQDNVGVLLVKRDSAASTTAKAIIQNEQDW